MTTPSSPGQLALDALLETIIARLEMTADLAVAADREARLDELAALCSDLALFSSAAARLEVRTGHPA